MSDSDETSVEVVVLIKNGYMNVCCISRDFYNLFGQYQVRFKLGVVNSFFSYSPKNEFGQRLQSKLGKLQQRSIQFNN